MRPPLHGADVLIRVILIWSPIMKRRHVSGHPSRDEMVDMYGLIRPKIAIPVHGTARHLQAHAELAKACQVQQTLLPNNGAMIRLNGSEAAIIDDVHTGAMTSEKGNLIELQSDVLRRGGECCGTAL